MVVDRENFVELLPKLLDSPCTVARDGRRQTEQKRWLQGKARSFDIRRSKVAGSGRVTPRRGLEVPERAAGAEAGLWPGLGTDKLAQG